VALGEGIGLPAAVVTAAVLTRGLGPEAYGRFAVAAMLVATLEWILIAIFANVVVKFIAEAVDWRPVAATAFRAYLLSGVTLGAALWLLSGWIAGLLNDPLLEPLLRLFAVEIPIFSAFMASRNVLAGRGRYRQQALMSGVRWLSRTTLIVLFVYLGWATRGAILGSIGSVLVGWIAGQTLVGWVNLGRVGFPMRRLVNLAVPVFLLMMSVRLFDQFGLLILNALGGSGPQVGFYGAAQNVSMVTGMVAATVAPILVSTLAAARRGGDLAHAREVVSGSLRATMVLIALAGIVAGSSGEIVELLFGVGFLGAAPLLSWLVFVTVALIFIAVGTSMLIAWGRVWPALVLTAPLLPLSLLGHFLLIPRLGAQGAAIVTTITAALSASICTLTALVAWHVRLPVSTLLRSAILGVAAYGAASVWPAPGLLVVVKAAILGVGVLVGFVLSAELSRGEIAKIRILMMEWRRRGAGGDKQRPQEGC